MSPENINFIIQLINGVGFPIVACLGMAAYIVWTKKQHTQSVKEQQETYRLLASSIDNNTTAITRLLDKFNEK